MNMDANPGAVTRHIQKNLCPCQKLKITVISGFRTKIAVVAKYRAKITVHCRGFWLPYKNYCGDQSPCNNYRALPWWLTTVQNIPWLPITVHQLLCNTVLAAYRGKRYRDEKSLPRKALKNTLTKICRLMIVTWFCLPNVLGFQSHCPFVLFRLVRNRKPCSMRSTSRLEFCF